MKDVGNVGMIEPVSHSLKEVCVIKTLSYLCS